MIDSANAPWMQYGLIAGVALLASALTFVSGFGLGTLLLPAFALFLPIEAAIASTAVVHLANGLLKAALMGRFADTKVLLRFGLPAAAFAALGAILQTLLTRGNDLATWTLWGHTHTVTPVGLTIGLVMIVFAAIELHPRFDRLEFGPRWLPVGGVVSGFFGGLSGHQGALRSAFLARSGLSKESFIGTGVLIAVIIDVVRLAFYLPDRAAALSTSHAAGAPASGLIAVGCAAAFIGTLIGQRALKKLTLRSVQMVVGVGLLIFGALLAGGVL